MAEEITKPERVVTEGRDILGTSKDASVQPDISDYEHTTEGVDEQAMGERSCESSEDEGDVSMAGAESHESTKETTRPNSRE